MLRAIPLRQREISFRVYVRIGDLQIYDRGWRAPQLQFTFQNAQCGAFARCAGELRHHMRILVERIAPKFCAEKYPSVGELLIQWNRRDLIASLAAAQKI